MMFKSTLVRYFRNIDFWENESIGIVRVDPAIFSDAYKQTFFI